jgi:hypothetical protein
MSTTLSHEISHACCLNLEVYTKAKRDPWQRARNLLVVHYLSKLPKETPNFSRNASKLFRRGN